MAERLTQGVLDLAREYDVILAGGDTNVWNGPLVTCVTVVGQPIGRSVQRSGAKPGDWLIVTGSLGGSLAGIVAFSLMSFLETPPLVWFAISFGGIVWLLKQLGTLERSHLVMLAFSLLLIGATSINLSPDVELAWSPHFAVRYLKKERSIAVNAIPHQTMLEFDSPYGAEYSLMHLLNKHSGGKPFEDVLIIGAGSGNDVVHALEHGAKHVDAVEIDPVIQRIGKEHHPEQPYSDQRVHVHIDDGRHYLRSTDQQYDLVVYALVDSLLLHSSYANIRMESYLFTEEAFRDVKARLKPDGTFVLYNAYRHGFVIARIVNLLEKVFGEKPIVFSIPNRTSIDANDANESHTVIAVGDIQRIRDEFQSHDKYWVHRDPKQSQGVNGFEWNPDSVPEDERAAWEFVSPTELENADTVKTLSTDVWPFLYLREPTLPWLNLRSMVMLGVLGLGMVWVFAPGRSLKLDNRMFFLGAGFMLLETKAVVHPSMLFGSTWFVNSLVFFTILIMILAANCFVLKGPQLKLGWFYGGLFLTLAINALVPMDVFLSGGFAWRYLAPCVLVMVPIFFAGVVFARSFALTSEPDHAFGSNIAGAVLGGLAEYFSMLLGFRYLLVLAMALYALSTYRNRS